MNKFHFLYVLQKRERRKKPHGDWVFIPLGMAITLALPLGTADFKDTLGQDKAAIHGAAVWGLLMAIVATAVLAARWIWVMCKYPPQTPEETLKEALAEMVAESHEITP